jgi:uncharacterized protein YjiS (DUF1127 family)
MSKTNLKAFRVWQQMKAAFTTWQDGANLRMELRNLDDRTLRDIGLSRGNERGSFSLRH